MGDAAEAVEPNVVQEAFPGFEGRAVRGASISLSTDHLGHRYAEGAIFSLCGLHEGLTPVESAATVNCRRCRVGAADALREQLHDLAEATDHVIHLEERIAYLRGVLGA